MTKYALTAEQRNRRELNAVAFAILLRRAIVVAVFVGHLMMGNAADAQRLFSNDKSEGMNVLDFDFAIATPGLAQVAAWSADSKRLAFPQFNSPFAPARAGPWVIDADRRTLAELTKGGASESAMAWSRDGKLFAFVPHRAEKLRFLSTEDFAGVASWTAAHASSAQCPIVRELAFTDGGDTFWVLCRPDGKIDDSGKSIVGALKLSYPGFQILDRATFTAPVQGRHTVLKNARLKKIGNWQYLVSIVASSIGQNQFGTHSFRYYAAATPLDGDKSRIVHFDFESKNESGITRAPKLVDFSDNFESAIVLYGVSMGTAHRPKLDRFFETYDVKSNSKTLTFGNQFALHCDVGDAAILSGWKYVVAAASCIESGGIIVFNLQTGEAVQRRMLAPTTHVFISPDRQRVAAGAGASMQFYKVRLESR